jgi:hypothetical protein
LALDNFDHAHSSYHDHSEDDLKYAHWTGSIWDFEIIHTFGDPGTATSIAVDSKDQPNISLLKETMKPYGMLFMMASIGRPTWWMIPTTY